MSWWNNFKNTLTNWFVNDTGYGEYMNDAFNEFNEDQNRIEKENEWNKGYNYIDLQKDKIKEEKNEFVLNIKNWLDKLFYGQELSITDETNIAKETIETFENKQKEDGLNMNDEQYDNLSWWGKIKAGIKTMGNLFDQAKDTLKDSVKTLGNNVMENITGGESSPPEFAENALNQDPQTKEEIPDTTDTNIETPLTSLNYDQIKADMLAERDALWAREDAIRKETQEREDTAYQRAVDDMRAAGINPNLVGVSPANSGGGITSATGTNYTPLQVQSQQEIAALGRDLEEFLKIYETSVNNEFKGNENEKDRFLDAAGKVLTAFISYKLFKTRK